MTILSNSRWRHVVVARVEHARQAPDPRMRRICNQRDQLELADRACRMLPATANVVRHRRAQPRHDRRLQ